MIGVLALAAPLGLALAVSIVCCWRDVTRLLTSVQPELCICCTEQDATRPAPDGGSGGVCDECDEALR